MNKFLYKIEKKNLEEKIEIKLYYISNNNSNYNNRNNNYNNKIEIIEQIPYTILIEEEGFKKLNLKSENINIINKKFKNKEEKIVIKLEIENKELFKYILDECKDRGIKIFEADLPSEHRYLIDKNINILENKNKNEEIPKLKYISIDIETIGNKNNQEIILISTYTPIDNYKKYNKVYISINKLNNDNDNKNNNNNNYNNDSANLINKIKNFKSNEFKLETFESEKELLNKFKKDIIEFNPNAIIGWNVIDFDFKIIKERMNYHSIKFNFSNSNNNCKLKLNSDFFRDSSMNCDGLLILDIIQILKSNYINFKDFKLDTVSKEILNDNKINLNNNSNIDNNSNKLNLIEDEDYGIENKLKLIENLFINDTIKLIQYNFKDSLLVSKITEKLGLLELMQKRSIITQTPISKVKSPIATLDIMYLKELHKLNLVANSNFNYNNSNQIEGAYVIEPKPEFYENIYVLDFKSLYPSIIMTFNIDPFTFINNYDNNNSNKKIIIAPNGAKFKKEIGILPKLIKQIYDERDIAKKENDKIKSYALKITMNSFYGAMASPKSRFHNRDVGGAITAFGREILHKAKLFVEKRGDSVIYGDTDSLFIKINGLEFKDDENKKKEGILLENELNEYFNKWVKEKFNVKSYLKIEFEKLYSKFFIASKKRYVGFNLINSKLDFVGMEAIRGDWTELAKEFQKKLVEIIFNSGNDNEIKKFIIDEVNKLKNGKYDDKLIYIKKITKPLKDYTKTTPPHVKAAREVKNFEGRIVKYVMTIEGPKHISFINKLKRSNKKINYDYEHYIEKQMNGVSDDLLKYKQLNFNEIIKSNSQKSLDKFF